MEDFVYSAISNYFQALKKLGYYKYANINSLLVLLFYYHLIFEDYRGYISSDDYKIIGKALSRLYGTNCLIPYPDYLKMGKLKLGAVVEMAQRIKTLEDSEVLKLIHDITTESDEELASDVAVMAEDEE